MINICLVEGGSIRRYKFSYKADCTFLTTCSVITFLRFRNAHGESKTNS